MSTSSSRRHLAVWLERLATDRLARTSPRPPEPAPPSSEAWSLDPRPATRPPGSGTSGSWSGSEAWSGSRPSEPRHGRSRDGRAASGGAPARTALVTTVRQGSAVRLAALDAGAAALGLAAGMTLADARARHPALVAVEADPAADARALAAIADWCDRFTPLVALDAPDGLMLDISGCAHLFGGEAALRDAVVAGLARSGFRARAAIADTAALAAALARFGREAPTGGENGRGRGSGDREAGGGPEPGRLGPEPAVGLIVAPGESRAALAPLPLAALRLEPATLAALDRAGLVRVADVLDLPRAPLAARFGAGFVEAIDRALGRSGAATAFRRPPPLFCVERRFAEPLQTAEQALAAADRLGPALCERMEAHGEGARRIELTLFRVDGAAIRAVVGSGRPLAEPGLIRTLLAEKIAGMPPVDAGFGFDVVRLSALATEEREAEQRDLADAATAEADLPALLDRLAARFGAEAILRLMPQDTHLPERTSRAVPAAEVAAGGGRSAQAGAGGGRGPSSALRAPSPTSVGEGGARGGRRGGSNASAHDVRGSPASPAQDIHRIPASPAGGRSSRQGDEGGGARRTDGPCSAGPPDGAPGVGAQAPPSGGAGTQDMPSQDTLQPARPIRLFRRPEAIEAVAEVPDGPPRVFRWRRVLHDVVGAEGPERIADDWWRADAGPTRDYFRVETAGGARLWLCRAGGYGDPGRRPRWYVHGLFA